MSSNDDSVANKTTFDLKGFIEKGHSLIGKNDVT